MYETVRVIKGHSITRVKGYSKHYYVRLDQHKRIEFKTIKAAAEWIEKNF